MDTIPIIGEVPMVFYIPDTAECGELDEKRKLKILIEKNGGLLSEFHECFTYQIEPITDTLTPKHYFGGDIYSARWIIDSVKEGHLQNREDYFSYANGDDKCKRLGFGKANVRYTITEAIKVFQIALQNKSKSKSAQFWMQVERE